MPQTMDLNSFAGDDFDPKQWINKAWNSSGNQEKEAFVSNSVTRLQLYMKQLTNSLDETTTQIVTSIPRILQDASSLQVEGALLQQQLLSLESKVQGVEEQTGHSIESLQRIDQLKSRLENAASSLREADKWAALATGLEDILESGVPTDTEALNQLSERVAAMTASLEVLSDAPDYESKRLQLETLYNRLEAAISPPLIEALTNMDAAKTSTYVSLLSGMGRSVSAYRCWRRAAASGLAARWSRLSGHSAHHLHRLLVPHNTTQVEWLTNVLKSETPVAELMRLYTDLLLSLEPSPTKVVLANLKLCTSAEEGILMITDVRRDTDEFVKGIKAVMDANSKETVPVAIVRELCRAAYGPLRELLPKYTELQGQLLQNHIAAANTGQDDLLEHSRTLLTTAERCSHWLETAHSTGYTIGGTAIYPYLAPAIEAFITALSSQLSSHGRRIESSFLSTSGQMGAGGGVLSACFPAALTLHAAATQLLDAAQTQHTTTADDCPLLDLPTLLLEPETIKRLPAARAEPQACLAALRRTKEHLRNLAKVILRQPVEAQLETIPQLSVWCNNDALATELPDFALSPQEYITEIGQYLMTLPQHLEMHLSEKQAPWQFLSEVCTHTCEVYAEKILNIKNMDALGTRRCLTDIVYLSSVVEDLGGNVTPGLRSLEKTLRAAAPSHGPHE